MYYKILFYVEIKIDSGYGSQTFIDVGYDTASKRKSEKCKQNFDHWRILKIPIQKITLNKRVVFLLTDR